jgi:hypothetical protein
MDFEEDNFNFNAEENKEENKITKDAIVKRSYRAKIAKQFGRGVGINGRPPLMTREQSKVLLETIMNHVNEPSNFLVAKYGFFC